MHNSVKHVSLKEMKAIIWSGHFGVVSLLYAQIPDILEDKYRKSHPFLSERTLYALHKQCNNVSGFSRVHSPDINIVLSSVSTPLSKSRL